MSPLRVCAEAGCPTPATYRGRCRLHARSNDKRINRAGKALYSTKRWAVLRAKKLSLNPICEWDHCREIATDVHHKHGVDVDPWSLGGLESLCHIHHSRTTRLSQLPS